MWSEIVSVLTDVGNSIADVVDEVAEGIFVGPNDGESGGASSLAAAFDGHAVAASTAAAAATHDTSHRVVNGEGPRRMGVAPRRGAPAFPIGGGGMSALDADESSIRSDLSSYSGERAAARHLNHEEEHDDVDDDDDDDDPGASTSSQSMGIITDADGRRHKRTSSFPSHLGSDRGGGGASGSARQDRRCQSPDRAAADESPATAYARKHQQLVRMRRLPGAENDRPALGVLGVGGGVVTGSVGRRVFSGDSEQCTGMRGHPSHGRGGVALLPIRQNLSSSASSSSSSHGCDAGSTEDFHVIGGAAALKGDDPPSHRMDDAGDDWLRLEQVGAFLNEDQAPEVMTESAIGALPLLLVLGGMAETTPANRNSDASTQPHKHRLSAGYRVSSDGKTGPSSSSREREDPVTVVRMFVPTVALRLLIRCRYRLVHAHTMASSVGRRNHSRSPSNSSGDGFVVV